VSLKELQKPAIIVLESKRKRLEKLGITSENGETLDEYDHELASFIQAALSGLLANRGYADGDKFRLVLDRDLTDEGEVNYLCQQAAQIGEEQFYRWVGKVKLLKKRRDRVVEKLNKLVE